jgi:hypothetical protein
MLCIVMLSIILLSVFVAPNLVVTTPLMLCVFNALCLYCCVFLMLYVFNAECRYAGCRLCSVLQLSNFTLYCYAEYHLAECLCYLLPSCNHSKLYHNISDLGRK